MPNSDLINLLYIVNNFDYSQFIFWSIFSFVLIQKKQKIKTSTIYDKKSKRHSSERKNSADRLLQTFNFSLASDSFRSCASPRFELPLIFESSIVDVGHFSFKLASRFSAYCEFNQSVIHYKQFWLQSIYFLKHFFFCFDTKETKNQDFNYLW